MEKGYRKGGYMAISKLVEEAVVSQVYLPPIIKLMFHPISQVN